jgi:spermidine synthase/S-adenosylmethionine decarboxylase proenzyme
MSKEYRMKPLGRQLLAEFIHCGSSALNDKKKLDWILEQGIKQSGLTLISISGKQFHPVGVTSIAVISESHIAIHTYPEAGHASVDIFTCANGAENVNALLSYLKKKLKPQAVKVMEVSRGNPLTLDQKNWITSFSGTAFEVKYHIDALLFSKKTKYQQLDIIENRSFGRMMFLDKDLQVAEKDAHVYDSSMVSPIVERKNSFTDVAILGGGDGGVLREVLKHKPGSAWLVDIDGEVISAAKKYMPSVCEEAFDSKKAHIVIDDAHNFLEQDRRFDAIIYDLTMHPEAITHMDRTEFLSRIFSKVRNSLKDRGVVSMQCCSDYDTETRKLLAQLLPRYFKKIKYNTVLIPSFCENWVFASAERK